MAEKSIKRSKAVFPIRIVEGGRRGLGPGTGRGAGVSGKVLCIELRGS